ncbi:MAG: ATP-binding protein [Candidatus Poribacteria bacterium]|nr:ATP-binding protein [Candidatus Poribacteria bacterium]
MRFTRIQLRNWKNFQNIDIKVGPRVFLIGPNACGKSNFLDAIRFLRDLVLPGGGLRSACDARGGVSKIRCLSARGSSRLSIKVEMLIGDNEWSYQLEFTQEPYGKRRPVLKKEIVQRNGERILLRPDKYDDKDLVRLSQTYLEQISANADFREVADAFEKISYLHLVPQVVRGSKDLNVQSPAFQTYGHGLLERMASANKTTRRARFRRIEKALQTTVPQLTNLSIERDDRGVPHLNAKYEHWRPHGANQTEEQFSDGTLRLIGLLWALQDGEGPLLMEEPELSLHEAVVQHLPQLIYRALIMKRRTPRQVVISTHNATLLMDEGIGPEEVAAFYPMKEGTKIQLVNEIPHIRALMQENITAGNAAIPSTDPKDAHQLAFALD